MVFLRRTSWGFGLFAEKIRHPSTRLTNGEVVLVAIYAKAKFDNMPVEILKSWKEAYDGQSQ